MNPDDVQTRLELAAFIDEMSTGSGDFSNDRLDSFLEAMAAWISDSDGYFLNRGDAVPEDPTWSFLALSLLAATEYE